MTAQSLLGILATSLVLAFGNAQPAGSAPQCETYASGDRLVDCIVDRDIQTCEIIGGLDQSWCGLRGNGHYSNTRYSDNVVQYVKQGAPGETYQCEDPSSGETVTVFGDYTMEFEWVFENVPAGVQYLVYKGHLDPNSEETYEFWYNENEEEIVDCVWKIPNSYLNPGNDGQQVAPVRFQTQPLPAGRYRIRLFDDPHAFPDTCEDLWRDNVGIDLLKIVTEWTGGADMPDTLASSDQQTGPGNVLFGTSYYETLTSDNDREQIRESLDGGISKLSHTWRFTNITAGCYRLIFEGFRTSNQEGDNFQFSWAPDVGGAPGTFEDIPGAIINQHFEMTGGLSVPFTPSLSGTIYIRVRDTNQTSGSSLDTLKMDFLAIRPQI